MGVRYASAVEETPRGTALIIGRSCADWETCKKPTERASEPIARSWSGNVYECTKTMASER
jgi:hypothetical protein